MIKQDRFILIWMENLLIQDKITDKDKSVVDSLNLRIDSGEFVCISGLYGPDKISFINTLGCLDRPDAGKYLYNYIDTAMIEKLKLDCVRSGIGFLFRNLNLIEELTVYQNIEIPIQTDSKPEKNQAILDEAEKLGLSSLLNSQVKKLTELEKHKVAMARALAVKPILIIADEPASNLKEQDANIMLDFLQELNVKGTAVICFSERKQLCDKAERHIIFENGSIISDNKVLTAARRLELYDEACRQ
ncbi:MAG: hypothetical protein A2Y23_05380 [Clostridiales bacterium GWB2_37_7]|nr:MAG: hypothetical protein A2Y23_05380 [Clostridiales bacterium GWB2_37_7]